MKRKNLIKKLSSAAVTVSMLGTALVSLTGISVSAAMTANTANFTWWVHNNGATSANWTMDVGEYDGSNALHIVNATAASGEMQILNPYSFVNMPAGEKWQITFDMKSSGLTSASKIYFSMNHPKNLTDMEGTAVADRSGWYSYSVKSPDTVGTGVVNYGNHPGLFFRISGTAASEVYIDNVHMYKLDSEGNADTTVDYVEDGNFESGKAYGWGSSYTLPGSGFECSGWRLYGMYGAKYYENAMTVENVTDEARTGNGSLRIIRKGGRNILPVPMMRLQTTDTFAAGTYTLSFYFKGTINVATQTSATTSAGHNWWLGNVTSNMGYATNWTSVADEDHEGWTKYSTTITSTSKDTLRFNITDRIDGYIDDVSLKNSSGDEMLSNGTFDVEVPDPNDYEPANPFIISTYKTGGVNNISWRNPVKDTLSKVSLYKLTDDEWTLVSDAYSVTPQKVFEIYDGTVDSPLDTSTVYTYKLRFDFSDGERREVVLSCMPQERSYSGRKAGNQWTIPDRDSGSSNLYFLPNNAVIDTDEKASGNASLHIFTNSASDASRPSEVSNWTTAYYSRLQQSGYTTAANKYYRLTYKIKVNNATKVSASTKRIMIVGGARNMSAAPYDVGSTDGWVEKSMELTHTASAASQPIQWYIGADDVQDIWLDDVAIYELDGQGGEVVAGAENLVTDGGFEDYTAAAIITETSSEAGNKKATFSWTAPADSRYIRIYEVTDDGDMLRAVCEPSAEEAVVENLTNYSAYTFKIQSQNTNGVLSTPVTVSVTPVPPAYEIESDYTLKVGGVSTESITGNGTYTVSLDVTNYSQADFAPALIIALYKDDKLVTFDKLENTISADGASKTLSTPGIELTDYDATAKYTISAFFWDGFNEMSPLYPCKSWANQQQ